MLDFLPGWAIALIAVVLVLSVLAIAIRESRHKDDDQK